MCTERELERGLTLGTVRVLILPSINIRHYYIYSVVLYNTRSSAVAVIPHSTLCRVKSGLRVAQGHPK